MVFWFRVATLAAATVPEEIFDPFNAVKLAPDPLNVVAARTPVEELNVKFDPLLGGKSPVAAVANSGKQVVSVDSSATVTLVAVVAVAELPVEDPEEPVQLPVTLPVTFPVNDVAAKTLVEGLYVIPPSTLIFKLRVVDEVSANTT